MVKSGSSFGHPLSSEQLLTILVFVDTYILFHRKTYKDWLKADLRQILVETHHSPGITNDFFHDLQREGFAMYVSRLYIVSNFWL